MRWHSSISTEIINRFVVKYSTSGDSFNPVTKDSCFSAQIHVRLHLDIGYLGKHMAEFKLDCSFVTDIALSEVKSFMAVRQSVTKSTISFQLFEVFLLQR